ncbi:hypothetical protein HPB52_009613 [Rhipicephalus sanguineus]|uniref:Selenoprotein P N-terminal domain-containing protein n=1 Tax=Rhipicephalus sanguineus TaxID=34632 RepID=A0A9D4Q5T7_RHISA|nr:hypothetical protein HPB52_009613 [Rhipicephalus sanguineus]
MSTNRYLVFERCFSVIQLCNIIGGKMAARLLVLLAGCLQAAAAARTPICGTPEAWTVGGQDPLAEHRGNVTLVALLKAS